MIVTFDIADGSFDYYTDEEWEIQLTEWRDLLDSDGFAGMESMDEAEVVDMMYGEEMFFEEVPQEKIK
tara:strand:- start:3012 stop:3215 length:204 start_codon:yes stop_codon:yes gene_type:complete